MCKLLKSCTPVRYCKINEKGFSLFEFIVVVVIIGLLSAKGLDYYRKAIDDSRRVSVEFVARNFTAAIAAVHAQWLIHRRNVVAVDNVTVVTNKFGWPVHSLNLKRGLHVNRSLDFDDALGFGDDDSRSISALACYGLWQSLLQNPIPATVAGTGHWGQREYHISAVNGDFCRVELVTTPKGTHYFDYIPATGQVFITSPSLKK